MKTWIALIRGINVGTQTSLDMKALEKIFLKQGFLNVRTYIRSGNVVFESDNSPGEKEAGAISKAIGGVIGRTPHVLFLSASALKKARSQNPFDTTTGKALHFYFLDSTPKKPDFEGLKAVQKASEEFLLKDKVFYLYAPEGMARSKLAVKVEKCLGVQGTARNLNTVDKLIEMAK